MVSQGSSKRRCRPQFRKVPNPRVNELRPRVKLLVRVSPSVARDIDALIQKSEPHLGGHDSRSDFIRAAMRSFLNHEFDPFVEGGGHADWSENWGRILPRPADTLTKVVKESFSIRIAFRLPRDFVSRIDTSAHPYQVKKLFRNCWIIGRRFRLAHVKFGMKVIEVATFRRQLEPGEEVVQDGVPARVIFLSRRARLNDDIRCGSLAPQ